MKISFQMIVFNALFVLPKGMLKACLDNIYPFAHEILISEGAVESTQDNKGTAIWASKDGRSTDETLDFLYSYDDPEHKIKIFIKDGYWHGKTEMCNAIAENATGDYLWEIDSDEFYHQSDMERIIEILNDNDYDRVDFFANHFFGDWEHCCDERHQGWANLIPWMRIFKHEKGSRWYTHAPPVYLDSRGVVRNNRVLSRDMTLMMGIKLYHYSFVSKLQVEFKNNYYRAGGVNWVKMWEDWQNNHDMALFGNDKSLQFFGNHPRVIKEIAV